MKKPKLFESRRSKSRLNDAFIAGGMYLAIKRDGRTTKILPKVHRVDVKPNLSRYYFTIPTGMDPKLLVKNEFAFRQVFGESIEINATDARNYNLAVYSQRFEGIFDYDYADISATFRKHRIPICAGKDVHGALQTYDMAEFPHLLIAGETGAGKSTQLRAILTSLIQSRKAIDFYLADMKRSEFHLFRRVDRVKEVVTDAPSLALILRRIRAELDARGKLLDDHELTHIDEFNALKSHGRRNYIVVAIDEVALLKKERAVMETLEEISAIGRALGVFLILSMQRPDADVLDGKLKNNLTVRMAFKQADKINSRIALGKAGAEDLTDKGRMLIKREQITEIQAPFLALERAKEILAEFRTEKPKEAEVVAEIPAEAEPEADAPIFGLLDD